MTNWLGRTAVAATAALLLAGAQGAEAQSAEEFYAGKTVTLLVGAAPGGMADSVARGFADVFQSHIPGNPTIVVQNLPGAGGLVAAAQLSASGADDGTEIGFLLGNVFTTPLVTGKNQFDPREVQWLGAIDSDDYPYAAYAFEGSPVQSAEEMLNTKMVVGSTSFTNYNRVFPAMLNEFAGTQFEIVSGYKGSGEVYIAMERGEVDGWFEGSQTVRSPIGTSGEYIKGGRMKPILLMATEKDERHPELPVAMDFITDPEQQAVANFIIKSSSMGRPLAVPASVPEDRVAALRQAIADTFADPKLKEEMMKSQIAVARLQDHDYIATALDDFYGSSEAVVAKVRSFMVSE